MPRRSNSYYEDDWYPPSRPRAAKDGIKAKNVRGVFGESWWAKRWISTLETFGWGNRLQRGRSYARSGQVLNIDLQAGRVQARVQGSRATPYKVKMEIAPLSNEQWSRSIAGMARQAIFGAKLLAGEMPQNIEDAFTDAGVALLPQNARDIVTGCSCPDVANPCKHIAAVYYLLGERFDEDPFLIFHLRGRTRDQIIEALRARRAAATSEVPEQIIVASDPAPALTDLLSTFYQSGSESQTFDIQIVAPEQEASLLRRLGSAPAGTDATLHSVYGAITQQILDMLFGENMDASRIE